MLTINVLKRIPCALAFWLCWVICNAQNSDCNCAAHFAFVQSYMQKNHAAFKDNVTPTNKPVYLKFCKSLGAAIEKDSCKTRCRVFIDRFLKFFKDRHIYIDEPMPPGIDENDSAVLAAFKQSPAFINTASISLDEAELKTLEAKGSNEIEGIYTSFPNPGYSIALVKQDGRYKGIVLESATKLWERGQVKFVLTPVDPNTWSATVLMKDHSPQEKIAHFNEGTFKELFLTKNRDRMMESSPFGFKKINDSTCYVKVSSFVGELYSSLDSFYKAHFQQIVSTPY